jgi:hypothetical protein
MSTIIIPVLDVSVIVVQDKDVTVARAALDGITVTASARREPGDRPDAGIGADLATARALARLASKLERRVRGRVRHAESIKADRQARKLSSDPGLIASLAAEHDREEAEQDRYRALADEADIVGRASEHQSSHDPLTLRVPDCPLCASWDHPAAVRNAEQR